VGFSFPARSQSTRLFCRLISQVVSFAHESRCVLMCIGLFLSPCVSRFLVSFASCPVTDLIFMEELVLISLCCPADLKHFVCFSHFAMEGSISLINELL
jgi:hypothetical protein